MATTPSPVDRAVVIVVQSGAAPRPLFPTFGTEILISPWVKEPVEATEFACFAAMSSLAAAFAGQVSGNVIVFSKVPFLTPLIAPVAGPATIVGVGSCASEGLAPPGRRFAYHRLTNPERRSHAHDALGAADRRILRFDRNDAGSAG